MPLIKKIIARLAEIHFPSVRHPPPPEKDPAPNRQQLLKEYCHNALWQRLF